MSTELDDLRARWQDQRQALLQAEYNHADEVLAQVMFFAEKNPIISGILHSLRSMPIYQEFDPEKWHRSRGDSDVLGGGDSRLGFSLDEVERISQSLKILEYISGKFLKGPGIMWLVGNTIYGGQSSHLSDRVESVITSIFDPFYHYVVSELRNMSTLITPSDMIKEIQSLVDGEVSVRYPATHKLLVDSYKALFTLRSSSSGSSWYTIGYSCRAILLNFSEEIYSATYVPKGQEIPKSDDAGNKLKWAARHFLKSNDAGDSYQDSIEKLIDANWRFTCSVGHRRETSSEYDARLSLIYTYLTISIFDELIQKNIEK